MSPPMTLNIVVVNALDQETAQQLLSLLENTQANDKYQALKQRLLATLDFSQQERAAISLTHFLKVEILEKFL